MLLTTIVLSWQYNKLRKYRTQVISLEAELQEHKLQASTAKNKYADWNAELQQKMKELREEKKQWLLNTGSLRTSQKETQVREFTSVLHSWNFMNPRRSSMHNPSYWRMRPIRYFFYKRRRKKPSTRSIGYETMSGRLKSISRIRKCGMSLCLVGTVRVLSTYRDEDFQRFNNRENEIRLMQSQYKQMQMRLESMEGMKAEMEDNLRYL
jgi:hypothetical protein